MNNPFQILGNAKGEAIAPKAVSSDTTAKIKELLSEDVILFMKGNPGMPQCGFSANSLAILNQYDRAYKTYDILQDPEIRQGLKEYSNWPTFPQLYVKGELIGGNDILTELSDSGELKEILEG